MFVGGDFERTMLYLFADLAPAPSENGAIVAGDGRLQVSHVNVQGSVAMGEVTHVVHHGNVTVVTGTDV